MSFFAAALHQLACVFSGFSCCILVGWCVNMGYSNSRIVGSLVAKALKTLHDLYLTSYPIENKKNNSDMSMYPELQHTLQQVSFYTAKILLWLHLKRYCLHSLLLPVPAPSSPSSRYSSVSVSCAACYASCWPKMTIDCSATAFVIRLGWILHLNHFIIYVPNSCQCHLEAV